MNLNLKHIILILSAVLLSACARDNKSMKNMESASDAIELDEEINTETFEVESEINAPLINQKLQDFYDLIALQKRHPEFTDDVTEQLKNYTTDSINNFDSDQFVIIKNLKQIGQTLIINDSVQKIKLTYNMEVKNIKKADTIYAVITTKIIMVDDKSLVSNKVHFSKN